MRELEHMRGKELKNEEGGKGKRGEGRKDDIDRIDRRDNMLGGTAGQLCSVLLCSALLCSGVEICPKDSHPLCTHRHTPCKQLYTCMYTYKQIIPKNGTHTCRYILS